MKTVISRDVIKIVEAIPKMLERDEVDQAGFLLGTLKLADLRVAVDELGFMTDLRKGKAVILDAIKPQILGRSAAGRAYFDYEGRVDRISAEVRWTMDRIRMFLDPPRSGGIACGWRNPLWAPDDLTEAEEHEKNLGELRQALARLESLVATPCPWGNSRADRLRGYLTEKIKAVLSGEVPDAR